MLIFTPPILKSYSGIFMYIYYYNYRLADNYLRSPVFKS
jgi:hypothetical protein